MFIDFVTLLLVNMAAGYMLLAAYVFRGLDDPEQPRWGLGFLPVGIVGLLFGGHMTVTWPLPGPFSSAYGELSVLLGTVFLVAAYGLLSGRDLRVLMGYAVFAGAAAVVVGLRFVSLGLTPTPLVSGFGIAASGAGGMAILPLLLWFREYRVLRLVGALGLLGVAFLWMVVAIQGYWGHMESFDKWVPLPMR